jgi:phosphatidate cytidylyltransferase
MTNLDPYRGADPREPEPPGAGQYGPPARTWPDDGETPRVRSWRETAEADTYAGQPGVEPVAPYWSEGPSSVRNGVSPHPSNGAPPYRPHPSPYGDDATGPWGLPPQAPEPVYRPSHPDAETNPIGWPPVAADPAVDAGQRLPGGPGPTGWEPPPAGPESDPDPDPEPPRRRGPGRRRAGRGGRPVTAGSPTGEASPAGPDPGPTTGGPEAGTDTATAAGPVPTSRAGRNLPMAIAVGLGLGALILVPLFVYPPAFLLVVAVAAGVGIWEMARAVERVGARPPLVPLLAGGLLMIGLAWWAGPDALSLGLLVTLLAVLVWRLGDGPAGFQRDLTATALIVVYVPFLGGFAALLAATPGDGHLRVLVTLVAVVLSDVGGYAAGVTLGRHPMAPSVSPKKSWEGFAGSVLAAAVGSAVLLYLLLDVAPWWGALFGLAVSVAAVLGDLGESMIKRDIGIKDMSNLLPGHGGMMDRLDSVLFAVPTAYLLLALFAPAG